MYMLIENMITFGFSSNMGQYTNNASKVLSILLKE